MNVRFDHRAIRPEFLALGDAVGLGELHDAPMQLLQGRRANQRLAIPERAVIRHGMVIETTKPAPFDATCNLVMGGVVTPAHEGTCHRTAQCDTAGVAGRPFQAPCEADCIKSLLTASINFESSNNRSITSSLGSMCSGKGARSKNV